MLSQTHRLGSFTTITNPERYKRAMFLAKTFGALVVAYSIYSYKKRK